MMRKGLSVLLFGVVMIPLLFLTSCSSGSSSDRSTSPGVSSAAAENSLYGAESLGGKQPASSATQKILVAYFSRVGNTNFSDNVDAETSASLNIGKDGLIGSTEIVAKQIHDLVGGDLVEIQTVAPYPADYRTTVQQNVDESKAGLKPELKTKIKNMDSYDTIYLGYPTWAMNIPRPIASFLSEYDFKGKTLIPFNTNGGYGLGSTVDSIKELCPDATMLDAFEMPGANVRDAQGVQEAVSDWLRKIGSIK
jgi:Flavodoxins